jgi:hypothetical protein
MKTWDLSSSGYMIKAQMPIAGQVCPDLPKRYSQNDKSKLRIVSKAGITKRTLRCRFVMEKRHITPGIKKGPTPAALA